MERLCRLLFELSSSERMNIMLEIQKQRLKMSHISRKLDMTVTETSRHLQRLGEARLIERDVEGLYGLTPFGVHVLSLLSGLGFVSRYRDYFVSTTCHVFLMNSLAELANLQRASRELRPLRTWRKPRRCFEKHGNTSGFFPTRFSRALPLQWGRK